MRITSDVGVAPRLIAIGLISAFATLGIVRGAAADDQEKATGLVQLYYTLQGNLNPPADVVASGVDVAVVLYEEGWEGSKLVDLVMRAHQEIPGAQDQPFEAVMPAYVRGHEVLADVGMGGEAQTATSSVVSSGPGTAPAAWNTDLSAGAQVGTDRLPPIADPRPALLVSGIVDLVGTVMYLVGALTIAEPGVPSGLLMGIGTIFFSSGAIIGNTALSVYQGAAVRRGAAPAHKYGAGAWILGGITIGATAGAFAVGAAAPEASTDDLLGLAILSLVLTSTAFGCEIANMASVRSKWRLAIDSTLLAETRDRVRPTIRPLVFASRDQQTGSLVPMAGFGGTF